jgi:hypothetical protein
VADDRQDVWDLLTLAFWFVFFAIGLMPELFFAAIRDAANVAPYTALVNSSAVISVAFSVYLALFTYRRCRDAGVAAYLAKGKALEVALVGLVAFLELPSVSATLHVRRTLLALVLDLGELPDVYLRSVILFVAASKLLAWSYLFSLVVRYHAFGNRAVFNQVPSIFPSMHDAKNIESDATAPARSDAPGAITPPDRPAEK